MRVVKVLTITVSYDKFLLNKKKKLNICCIAKFYNEMTTAFSLE